MLSDTSYYMVLKAIWEFNPHNAYFIIQAKQYFMLS